jgi:hypothetical protein
MTLAAQYIYNYANIAGNGGTGSVDLGVGDGRFMLCVSTTCTNNTGWSDISNPLVNGSAMTKVGGDYTIDGGDNVHASRINIFKYNNPPAGIQTLTGYNEAYGSPAHSNIFVIFKGVAIASPVGTPEWTTGYSQYPGTSCVDAKVGMITVHGCIEMVHSESFHDVATAGAGQEQVGYYTGVGGGCSWLNSLYLKQSTIAADSVSFDISYSRSTGVYAIPLYVLLSAGKVAISPSSFMF